MLRRRKPASHSMHFGQRRTRHGENLPAKKGSRTRRIKDETCEKPLHVLKLYVISFVLCWFCILIDSIWPYQCGKGNSYAAEVDMAKDGERVTVPLELGAASPGTPTLANLRHLRRNDGATSMTHRISSSQARAHCNKFVAEGCLLQAGCTLHFFTPSLPRTIVIDRQSEHGNTDLPANKMFSIIWQLADLLVKEHRTPLKNPLFPLPTILVQEISYSIAYAHSARGVNISTHKIDRLPKWRPKSVRGTWSYYIIYCVMFLIL